MEGSLHLHGYAADHEDDLVGVGGYVLVHPTLEVGESALDLVFGDSAQSDLISDEQEVSLLLGEAVKLFACGGEGGLHICLKVEEKVSAPKRDAVHYDHAAGEVVPAKCFFLLYVRPLRPASRLMTRYTLTELVVPYACGGHINRSIGQR